MGSRAASKAARTDCADSAIPDQQPEALLCMYGPLGSPVFDTPMRPRLLSAFIRLPGAGKEAAGLHGLPNFRTLYTCMYIQGAALPAEVEADLHSPHTFEAVASPELTLSPLFQARVPSLPGWPTST